MSSKWSDKCVLDSLIDIFGIKCLRRDLENFPVNYLIMRLKNISIVNLSQSKDFYEFFYGKEIRQIPSAFHKTSSNVGIQSETNEIHMCLKYLL